MPSHSVEQAKTMAAVSHGWHPKGSAANIPLRVAKEFHQADSGHKYGAKRDDGGEVLAEPDEISGLGSGSLMPVLSHYPTDNRNVSAPFSQRLPEIHGNVEDRRGRPESGYEHMLAGNQMIHGIARAIFGKTPFGDYPITYAPKPTSGKLQYEAGIDDIGKAKRDLGGSIMDSAKIQSAGLGEIGLMSPTSNGVGQQTAGADQAAPTSPTAGVGSSSAPPQANPALPINTADTNPAGSWTAPSFSAGNWSSAPGRDFGGGMTKPPNPNWMVRNEARSMLHSGPISSIVPGRTDRHNVHVASGSYVMPADAVSHLGQNNTKAGQAILSRMFSQGPYGTGMPKMAHGSSMPKGPGKMAAIPAAHIPKFQSAGGGKDDKTGEPVPVVVAGGEFTIPPEAVAVVGGGDIKRGHRVLDNWVMSLRKKHIATLKGLPPPVKS